MPKMTITEALAEIKTLNKRMDRKQKTIIEYLARPANLRDPHEKDIVGGSGELIRRERQALADMSKRIVDIRTAIMRANNNETITIKDKTMTITEWLAWRRDIRPRTETFMNFLSQTISRLRTEGTKKGGKLTDDEATAGQQDIIVNISEKELGEENEFLQEIIGTLDGQLSLKNATVVIEFE